MIRHLHATWYVCNLDFIRGLPAAGDKVQCARSQVSSDLYLIRWQLRVASGTGKRASGLEDGFSSRVRLHPSQEMFRINKGGKKIPGTALIRGNEGKRAWTLPLNVT